MTITLAVQTDTALAALWTQIYALRSEAQASLVRLANLTPSDQRKDRLASSEDRRTASEIVAEAEALVSDPFVGKLVVKHLATRQAAKEKISEIETEISPLQEIYEQHRWSRFFLVTSSQGHVHSSMDCSTCFSTTEYGWLPTLSGLTEADAVDQEGAILCSVCFPSAPTEWTTGISKAQAEKDAAKCSGSGQYAEWTGRNYVACPDCGASVSQTSTGKLRSHKPKGYKSDKQIEKDQRKQERAQKCYERALAAIEKFDLDLDADPDLYTAEISKLPSTVFSMLSDLCNERQGRTLSSWSDLPLVRR
jgi:hypothetical protein